MFKLQRYFSITSLAAFLIVAAMLGLFYRQMAVSELIYQESKSNISLTQAFANTLWPQFARFFDQAGKLDRESLQAHPNIEAFSRRVLYQIRGLPIVKIKIYDLNGITVFSTDAAQIGENQSGNTAFQSGLEGETTSSLVYRDSFNTYDKVIENCNLIQSYIPIKDLKTGKTQAVFELYSDITELLQTVNQTSYRMVGIVVLVLSVLYGALFLIVRHADNIIRQQYSDLQRTTQELAEARDQAMHANQFKTRLIETVTHDLRTPINVIQGCSELFTRSKSGSLSDKQQLLLQSMLLNSKRLTDLVDDLSYQSQLDSNALKIDKALFAPADLLDEVRGTMRPIAENKALVMQCHLDPELPPRLNGDFLHIKQILNNLTGNALKFTSRGTVEIALHRLDDRWWGLVVADTGPGIPEEAQRLIFEAHHKMAIPGADNVKGLGLGLFIVKQLADMMGGEVLLDSEPGKGSVFTIKLPLEVPA